jgi:hypothetical protein
MHSPPRKPLAQPLPNPRALKPKKNPIKANFYLTHRAKRALDSSKEKRLGLDGQSLEAHSAKQQSSIRNVEQIVQKLEKSKQLALKETEVVLKPNSAVRSHVRRQAKERF